MAKSVILLSILIPTIPSRVAKEFPGITAVLEMQSKRHAVEILGLYDNEANSVGHKRNMLLQMARGRYLTFVDDDDDVAPDYISSIFDVIRFTYDIDVVCYQTECRVNNGPTKLCKYSVEYKGYTDTPTLWTGLPAHTMIWRSSVAKQGKFPGTNFGEDTTWVKQVVPLVKKEVQIDRVLYYYNFRSQTTRTRGA